MESLFNRACLLFLLIHGSLSDPNGPPDPLSHLVVPPDLVPALSQPPKNQGTLLEDYLLPDDLVPMVYDVTLVPFLQVDNFTFNGEVRIEFIVIRNTRTIRLHAFELDIEKNGNISVSPVDLSTPLAISSWSLAEDDTHFLTIHLEQQLEAGSRYQLTISFVGQLNDQLDGFYRSSYKDLDGTTDRWLATTQFQATGARRAFPCWDEPRWKARFNIKLAFPPGYSAVSNMPAISTKDLNNPELPDWKITTFNTTMTLSPYLIAFLVSDYANVSSDPDHVGYSRPAFTQHLTYGLGLTRPSLEFMSEFTGQPYSEHNPKLDHAAIPDFAAGAMENWGLALYKEINFLYSETSSPLSSKFKIASVVGHEMAHQWFGNLVTCKWWSHIWICEGFSTYFSYLIIDSVEKPEWEYGKLLVFETQKAFNADSLETSQPLLRDQLVTPSEILTVFDVLCYSKASSLLRMLHEMIMGDENFKIGVTEFLLDRKLNIAGKDDLWAAMQRVADADKNLNLPAPIAEIMDSWVVKAGYPVITFIRNYTNGVATVSQSRFLTLPTPNATSAEYWVPIAISVAPTPNEISPVTWFAEPAMLYSGLPTAAGIWVLVNPNQAGYYRVNYDPTNWALLTRSLKMDDHGSIPVMSRAQLMDDALALARAGLLSYDIALETTSYIDTERDYVPLASGLGALSYLRDRLAAVKEERELFEYYGLNKTIPMYELLGGVTISDSDTELTRARTRPLILEWVCGQNHPDCNGNSSALFQQWMENSSRPIHPDLKSVVYCAAMREGGDAEYDFLFDKYAEVTDSQPGETSLILNALGCSNNVTRLNSLLEESISETSRIRPQDTPAVFIAVYSNPLGVDPALDFILTNYDRCLQLYGTVQLGLVLNSFSTKLNTLEHKQKLETFKATHADLGSLEPVIDAVIKTVEDTIGWHEAHHDTVVAYFRDFKDSGAACLSVFSVLTMAAIVALVFGAK